MKRTTMSDIAQRLNISKNAVSLALNSKPGVSDELRQKIIETAAAMHYGSLSTYDSGKSKGILVVVPEYLYNDTFFYADIFWMIEREAKRQGCLSITSSISKDSEQQLCLPPIPPELNILGLLLVGILRPEYIAALRTLGLPIVSVDIAYPELPLDSVTSANLSGAYMAVSYLIQCGHREIGFVGPVHTAQSVYERWCGYQQALLHHHIPLSPGFSITGEADRFELIDTDAALEPYLDRVQSFPTAWFCAGDCTAVSLVKLLIRRGLRVPEDISVIGFDDIAVAQLLTPSLTTMTVNRKLMGKLAVERLLEISKNPHSNPVNISLPPTLMVRESVAPPGKLRNG